jgi:hypothetical protein
VFGHGLGWPAAHDSAPVSEGLKSRAVVSLWGEAVMATEGPHRGFYGKPSLTSYVRVLSHTHGNARNRLGLNVRSLCTKSPPWKAGSALPMVYKFPLAGRSYLTGLWNPTWLRLLANTFKIEAESSH